MPTKFDRENYSCFSRFFLLNLKIWNLMLIPLFKVMSFLNRNKKKIGLAPIISPQTIFEYIALL